MLSFSNRLHSAVEAFGPLCVGLDPRLESLPKTFQELSPALAVEKFCRHMLDLVRPYSAIVKPQSAFFEQLGPDGFKVLQAVIADARESGFLVILDSKRGDIASTATAYATASFEQFAADALTVNPYLGADSIEPFITEARKDHRGLFVLVRTSNPGSGLFQNLVSNGQPLYRHVADAVVKWNDGRGDVGAVVGATHPQELKELRAAMPGVWFLVPGYGAQGGSADDVRPAYPYAIVNSSRGITFPFHPDDANWESQIEAAAMKAHNELR